MVTNFHTFTFLLSSIFFVFGLIIGSFLNVVIYRMNTRKSFFRSFGGRSACMSCQNKLCWYELIPLFSFLVLKGRCRNCKTKISSQYILVEFATGLIFCLLFLKFQDILFISTSIFAITYAYYAIMFSLLIVIVVYDLRHKIIPNTLSLFFGVLAFVGLFFFHLNYFDNFSSYSIFYWQIPSMLEFLSGILISLPFCLFWLISRGAWMGLGDAKLVLGLGYFLGLSLVFSAVVLAFWIGAIMGLGLVVFKKGYGMKSEIPFAPYLVLGTFIVFFFNLHLFVI